MTCLSIFIFFFVLLEFLNLVPPKVIYINSTRSFDNPNGGAGGGVGVAFRPLLSSSSNISSNHHYHQSELNSPFTLSSNHNSSSIFMVDAYEGEKIIIVCTVPYAKPPPRLKWYRKNIELLPGKLFIRMLKTIRPPPLHILIVD